MVLEVDTLIDKRCAALQDWRYKLDYPTVDIDELPNQHREVVLLAGNGNKDLAYEMGLLLGIKPQFDTSRFSNGEVKIKLRNPVRSAVALILQSAGREDVNGFTFEVFGMADAARRAGAEKIIGIIPYMPYCRQDKQNDGREPMMAQLVARFMVEAGINHIVTVDMHSPAVKGAVNIPWDDIYGSFSTHEIVKKIIADKIDNIVTVATDEGSVKTNRKQAQLLGIQMGGVLHKYRDETKENAPQVTMMSGNVRGRDVLMFDDMIDTAGTAEKDIEFVKEHGANSVLFVATHPVLSFPAIRRIRASQADKFIVTNSLALSEDARSEHKIIQVSISQLLAETSLRVMHKGNYQVSDLFR